MARHPRDVLYVEGAPFPSLPACEHYAGSEKLIRKAIELQRSSAAIFDVTMDLEDGAPEGREREHAEMVVDLLRSSAGDGHRRGVRVHGVHHASFETDLRIVLEAREHLSYLTIPKVRSVADVQVVLQHTGDLPLHVLIETHGALIDAFAIAALPQVEVLDFGLMDFVSAHHGAIPSSAMRSPGQFEHALVRRAKARIAAAALAGGAVPSHNVTIDLKNVEQVRSDAERAHREFGFLRMWSVHPAQIDPIVEAFRPPIADVERAAAVLLAARDRDWGPIELEGRLYDRASYRYEWELLQRARLSGAALSNEAIAAFFP